MYFPTVESARECCLEVGVQDRIWEGLAISGEADCSMARDNAQSDKGCGKTLDLRVAPWSGSTKY